MAILNDGDPAILTDGIASAPDAFDKPWLTIKCSGGSIPGGMGNPFVTFEFDLGSAQWIEGFAYVEGGSFSTNPRAVPDGIDLEGGADGTSAGPFRVEYFDPVVGAWMVSYLSSPLWDAGSVYDTRPAGQANFREWTASLAYGPRYASAVRITMQGSAQTFYGSSLITLSELKIFAPAEAQIDFAVSGVVATSADTLEVSFSAPFMPYSEYDADSLPRNVYTGDHNVADRFWFSNGMTATALDVIDDRTVLLHVAPPMPDPLEATTLTVGQLWSTSYQHLLVNTFEFGAEAPPPDPPTPPPPVADLVDLSDRGVPIPTGELGYGADLSCVLDLSEDLTEVDPFSVRAIGEATVRRLLTARGSLPDHRDYGLDVRGMCNRGVPVAELRDLGGQVRNEISKDDRIESAAVTVTSQAGGQLDFAVRITPAVIGLTPFSLTFAVVSGQLTVEAIG
jgi:hypothetical protein